MREVSDAGHRVKEALTPSHSPSPAGPSHLSPQSSRHASSRLGMKKRRSSGASKTEGSRRAVVQILDPPASPLRAGESAVDDENWESENEDSAAGPSSSSAPQDHKEKGISRSPSKGHKKVGHSIRQFVAGKSARRGSHSGGPVPTVTVTPASSGFLDPNAELERGRGRAQQVPPGRLERPSTAGSGGSASSFASHRQLDRLMSGEGARSRGHSPARSIRFVDHESGISGTRTPGTRTPPTSG